MMLHWLLTPESEWWQREMNHPQLFWTLSSHWPDAHCPGLWLVRMECEESRWPWLRHGVISKTPRVCVSPAARTSWLEKVNIPACPDSSWQLMTGLVDGCNVACWCSLNIFSTIRECHVLRRVVTWLSRCVTDTGQKCDRNGDKCGTIMTHRDVCGNAEMRSQAWFMRETAETISSQQSHSKEQDNSGGLNITCHLYVWSCIISLMLPFSVFTLTTGNSRGARCVVLPGLAGDDIWAVAWTDKTSPASQSRSRSLAVWQQTSVFISISNPWTVQGQKDGPRQPMRNIFSFWSLNETSPTN